MTKHVASAINARHKSVRACEVARNLEGLEVFTICDVAVCRKPVMVGEELGSRRQGKNRRVVDSWNLKF